MLGLLLFRQLLLNAFMDCHLRGLCVIGLHTKSQIHQIGTYDSEINLLYCRFQKYCWKTEVNYQLNGPESYLERQIEKCSFKVSLNACLSGAGVMHLWWWKEEGQDLLKDPEIPSLLCKREQILRDVHRIWWKKSKQQLQ